MSSALLLILFGLRPHGSSVDYPAHDTVQGFAIGATAISPDEVKKRFSVDLSRKGYIVIEAALYPESGSPLDVSIDDFLLDSVRPLTPATIGARVHGRKPVPGDPGIYGSVTVGYESARDNVAGGRQRGGVYTASSVGVGTQPPRQPDNTRYELEDNALPEGPARQPVAGYLYFPKPSGKAAKNGTYELVYFGKSEQVRLTVPMPKK